MNSTMLNYKFGKKNANNSVMLKIMKYYALCYLKIKLDSPSILSGP